jgi:magnesium transporter
VLSPRRRTLTTTLASRGTILAVAAAIAGIYEMNFKNMPELEWSLGYPAALLLMTTICVILYYLFRRIDWL